MKKRNPSAVAFLAALLAALTAAAPSMARDYTLGPIEIHSPWARATPPSAPAAGGYLTITNKGSTPDRLVAIETSAAAKAQVHEMKMDGSVMRMREIEGGLAVAPGQTVELKPGGEHVMFMQLKGPFVKDTLVPATLVFEKAGRIDIEFAVGTIAASGPPH